MSKFIFITRGVLSALGKGIAAASIGRLLESHGYSIAIKKFGSYLNVDPGTMNPFQHGEIYVTDDGAETDLDLGHYERFTSTNTTQAHNWTAGRIYASILKKGSLAASAYEKTRVYEHHRHRYEFNPDYEKILSDKGLVISGKSPKHDLVEVIDIKNHPWFLGCQFHPEFKSRPLDPHPIFKSFIGASYA
ncbi:MAG TPA: hypothetical protein ENL46_01590 [Candidatus Aminicenantes bacterium]|nr:hypothetical protein [Candidatus Aminicenantes bacterium]